MSYYTPQPGELVTVCRWIQPTLIPGDPCRKLFKQVTGRFERINGGLLYLSGQEEFHSLDYTFLGQGEDGCRYLVTEIYPGRLPELSAPEMVVTKGDVLRIVPEKGPERVMVVSHVERHVITLADPEQPACCAGDKYHDPSLAGPGCAQKWAG